MIEKRLNISKPYWNDDLSRLWKDMSIKENLFLKNRENRRAINIKRLEFKEARAKFDRDNTENRKLMNWIKICIDDPRKFLGTYQTPWTQKR